MLRPERLRQAEQQEERVLKMRKKAEVRTHFETGTQGDLHATLFTG